MMWESYSRNPFDFSERLRFDATTVTKIKISPGTPYLMMMDPNNPVVKLCIAGMQAEGEGDHELARGLFVQAWEVACDDYEACVAAHYLARHQPNPEETLRWNQESLCLAEAVGDDRVRDFFPSLLLNVGRSYEVLGNTVEARRYYDLAAARVETLPSDQYGNMVRNGIARGRQRVACNIDQRLSDVAG